MDDAYEISAFRRASWTIFWLKLDIDDHVKSASQNNNQPIRLVVFGL